MIQKTDVIQNHKIFPTQQLVLYMDDRSKALQSRFSKATEKEELKQRPEERKKFAQEWVGCANGKMTHLYFR